MSCPVVALKYILFTHKQGESRGKMLNVMYCFSDREQYRSIKADTEEDMNEMLRPSKQRAVVANAMFHKVLDNVGFVAKDYNLARLLSPYLAHVEFSICLEWRTD